MPRNYKIFSENITPVEPPEGLFDKIIFAIKREGELRQTKKLLFGFLTLLIVSLGSAPFSFIFLINEWKASGVSYFISTSFSLALNNASVFASLWLDFLMSIIEALPIAGVIVFLINITLILFTARLFLYKNGLLLKHLSGYIKFNAG